MPPSLTPRPTLFVPTHLQRGLVLCQLRLELLNRKLELQGLHTPIASRAGIRILASASISTCVSQ